MRPASVRLRAGCFRPAEKISAQRKRLRLRAGGFRPAEKISAQRKRLRLRAGRFRPAEKISAQRKRLRLRAACFRPAEKISAQRKRLPLRAGGFRPAEKISAQRKRLPLRAGGFRPAGKISAQRKRVRVRAGGFRPAEKITAQRKRLRLRAGGFRPAAKISAQRKQLRVLACWPWRTQNLTQPASGPARLHSVQARIQQACHAAGRSPEEVRLLAVSKTFPIEPIRELFQAGQVDFGENYVQEAEAKVAALSQARWHLIGPLQSNKAARAVQLFSIIHSLDRLSLAERLERLARESGRGLQAFVQVRLGEEDSKSGIDPEDLVPELQRWNEAREWKALRLVGLMTLPPPQVSRPYFARLRELRDQLQALSLPIFSDYQLSMGMSDDFEAAIAEGSNWVRVGRALFGSRKP
jgi:pyridoxal phosphate enzyme (YggS family)